MLNDKLEWTWKESTAVQHRLYLIIFLEGLTKISNNLRTVGVSVQILVYNPGSLGSWALYIVRNSNSASASFIRWNYKVYFAGSSRTKYLKPHLVFTTGFNSLSMTQYCCAHSIPVGHQSYIAPVITTQVHQSPTEIVLPSGSWHASRTQAITDNNCNI
jgi:hypothetical protein